MNEQLKTYAINAVQNLSMISWIFRNDLSDEDKCTLYIQIDDILRQLRKLCEKLEEDELSKTDAGDTTVCPF